MRSLASRYRQPCERPWVARLAGLSDRYRYDREFVQAKADYREANSRGTRGVWFWWTLESGNVYETRYRTSWERWTHRFLTVTPEGDVVDLTEEEVRTCLANAASESTS